MHVPLDQRFVDMVPEEAPGFAIAVAASRRKDPLPGPGSTGFRVLPVERPRQPYASLPLGILLGMMPTPRCQMPREWLDEARREDGDPILVALCLADRQLTSLEIDILDAESKGLPQPAVPRARQRSLQYFTCSQQAAHFRRH